MRMSKDELAWLPQKYGNDKLITPFEATLVFNYSEFANSKEPVVYYEYMLQKADSKKMQYERRLKRRELRIRDPNTYDGQASDNCYEDGVWVVNGRAERADGNYTSRFHVFHLGKSSIYFGSCPKTEDDVRILSKQGIKAAISLQTPSELASLGVEQDHFSSLFSQNEIYLMRHVPIDEFNPYSYARNLAKAAITLDNIISNKNKKVFVYSTSGISRPQTVIMAYLSYFKKVSKFNDLQFLEDLVLNCYRCSVPNQEAVADVLKNNQAQWDNLPEDISEIMLKLSNGTMSNDSKGSRKSSVESVPENGKPVIVEVDDLETFPVARSTVLVGENEPEVDPAKGTLVFSFANNGP